MTARRGEVKAVRPEDPRATAAACFRTPIYSHGEIKPSQTRSVLSMTLSLIDFACVAEGERSRRRDLDLGHLLGLARYAVRRVIGRRHCAARRVSRRHARHASPLCQSSDACSNRLLTRMDKEISSATIGRPSHSHLSTSEHSQPWASSLSSGSFARNG
jgi:hypothetical protein